VRNDPFLRGKPLTLEVGKMTPDQVESLCGRFSIAIFDKETAAAFGIEKWASTPADYNEKAAAVRARMREIGCGAPLKL
jgi:hypothetical protein